MNHMKSITIIFLLLSAMACSAQKDQTKNIESAITEFAKAGDENNSEKLAHYLDDNFRIVMNRLFGSTEVSVMPKSTYLEKIKSKEYGGDHRTVTIENIVINSTTATAKVIFTGKEMTFISLIVLIQDPEGNWKLTSETPIVA